MNTPLTDAVDAASYPSGAAHREALRKLCHQLEETSLRLMGQIATMMDEREAAEARVSSLETRLAHETAQRHETAELHSVAWHRANKSEARLRAVTEAGDAMKKAALRLFDGWTAQAEEDARRSITRWDAARSGDLPSGAVPIEKLCNAPAGSWDAHIEGRDLPSPTPAIQLTGIVRFPKSTVTLSPDDLPKEQPTYHGGAVHRAQQEKARIMQETLNAQAGKEGA